MKEDTEWMMNIKNDDYTSYNQLFMHYYPSLCLYVVRFINDNYVAEDIVQDLFIKLWTSRKQLDVQANVSAYLYQTAKNMSLNFLRDETNRLVLLETKWKDDLYLNTLPKDDYEYREVLEDCIQQLPARCREILLMHHVDGYKQKEIAEKLNLSIQTIKNQISNSVYRLRYCLKLKRVEGVR